MKIEIFDEGKRAVCLIFPTALLFNSLSAKIISKTVNGKAEDTDVDLRELTVLAETLPDSAEIAKLCAEIRRFKRTHPNFILAEATDESGDGVKITL